MTVAAPRRRRSRVAAIPADDIGHYLGFFGPVPWLLLCLYLVYLSYTALVLGAATSHTAWGLAAFAATIVALVAVVQPSPTPLPVGRTVLIVAVIVFSAAAVTAQLPSDFSDLGYATWEYNSCDLLMFCLAIRARILVAWVAQAAMQLVVAVGSTVITGSPVPGLLTSYTQLFPLVACSVFAFGLHWTARQIVAHRQAERLRAEEQTRADAAGHALEAELQAVRELAVPTLERIAAGDALDPRSVRALEAALRDRIRSPALAVEPLASVLRRVREEGRDVLVLDDLGTYALSDMQRAKAASWAADQVADSDAADLTIRIAAAHGETAVTVTADGRPQGRLVL